MTKKMYTNKPVVETEVVEFDKDMTNHDRRIEQLEAKVRHLSEQIHKMASALALNSRQIRRAGVDINNLGTSLRNK